MSDNSSSSLALFLQPAALNDLRRQATYLQQEAGDTVARRFLHAARASMEDLLTLPGMGTNVANRLVPDLRHWRVKGFEKILIFYRFDSTTVSVIRVLHGMQDLDALLNDE